MEPPVLLDENVEHEVLHRLRNYGHTVKHIDLHAQLQKGDEDRVLAQYSRSNQALIVTYDDDFETDYEESDYWGVLSFVDSGRTTIQVADVLHRIPELYPPAEVQAMNIVGREWV